MKSSANTSLYFSAYPLKAIELDEAKSGTSASPYLKAILCGKTKTLSRVRVMPMINPYSEKRLTVVRTSVLPADIELMEKEWYNNYE